MTRWLAGVFSPRRRADRSRLAEALVGHQATVADLGPLQVAYSGAERPCAEPLCLLDGCLDNARELSAELGVPGFASTEELLAASWRRWGPELLGRLRGDFALLIWDRSRRQGLLARDQLGVRSVFVHGGSESICFASEVRSLLALLPRTPAPDPVSLAHWVALSDRPGSATLFAGVRRLNPGAALLLDEDGVREAPYWAPRFSDPGDRGEPELSRGIRVALDRAVRRRIDPDRPTGVLMSGGLDSAAVAAVAAGAAPGQIYAYAGVFPDHPAVDETTQIAELREALHLPGVTAEVRAGGLLASAIDAIRAWGVPPVGWGDFWVQPLLRAAARAGVQTVLGGDGGDELFGARTYLLADRLRAGHPLQAARLSLELPGAGYRPPRRDVARMVGEVALLGALPYRLHELLSRPLAGSDAPRWLRRQARRDLLDSSDPLAWKRLEGPRWWAKIAHGLTRGIEETGVFEQQRRTAASAGLEARHPLLDLDLVELGLCQPALATFDRYLNRPVLRAAVAGLVPDAVRLRPQKVLFDSLLVDCLAGPDGPAVRRLLTDQAELGAYVDVRAAARELLESDRYRREQPFRWMWQVWRLSTAECWLRAQATSGEIALPADLSTSAASVELALAPSAATPSTSAPSAAHKDSYVFPP
jgi:asparagine synthase (glutamine-hydrolysing)